MAVFGESLRDAPADAARPARDYGRPRARGRAAEAKRRDPEPEPPRIREAPRGAGWVQGRGAGKPRPP